MIDLIKEDQIGKAAAEHFVSVLKTVPLAIEIRNASAKIGETDIKISLGT